MMIRARSLGLIELQLAIVVAAILYWCYESWESLKIIEECCGHDGRALYIHSTARLHSKRPDEAPDPRRVNVVSHIPCSSTACLFISDFYLCTCGSRSQFLLILTSYALRLLSLPTVHRVPINPCSLQFAFQFR